MPTDSFSVQSEHRAFGVAAFPDRAARIDEAMARGKSRRVRFIVSNLPLTGGGAGGEEGCGHCCLSDNCAADHATDDGLPIKTPRYIRQLVLLAGPPQYRGQLYRNGPRCLSVRLSVARECLGN